MPALDKATNLYAAFERVCPILKQHNLNATTDAVAAVIIETVLNDLADNAVGQNTDLVAWAMEPEQRELRKKLANGIKCCVTAAKNVQNSYLHPSGLMPKVESQESGVEFV